MIRGFAIAIAVVVLMTPCRARAQQPEAAEMEAIQCFRSSSASSVRVGEVFTVTLTCGVVETPQTTVVADRSRLDPEVVDLQPFEVLDGIAAPDVETFTRRYFQYEYRVRYLGDEIGRDQVLPALQVTYRVHNRTSSNAPAIESRERQYVIPPRPIRIVSLLPQAAADIRDPLPASFDEIRRARFVAGVLRIASWSLIAVGAVAGVLAFQGLRRRGHRAGGATTRQATDGAVLRGLERELAAVRAERLANGWSSALAARALAAVRIVASYQVAAGVAQVRKDNVLRPELRSEGQVRLVRPWPRDGDVWVSGAATAESLARERRSMEAEGQPVSAMAGELEDALRHLSGLVYSRNASVDEDRLDEALASGARAARTLRRNHHWVAIRLRAFRQSVRERLRLPA